MPQINEYLPQVEAQGPVGGTSPNLELAGAVGRGIERFGQAVEDTGNLIHRRNAQEETADIYSKFADARDIWTEKLQQQTADGSLDVDKFKEDYDNYTQSIGDNINTPEGRNFFERQKSRLQGTLLLKAQNGSALIAKNEALGQWQNGINKTSSALMRDPSDFPDAYHAGLETLDQMVSTGVVPEKMRDKVHEQMATEYAKGAVRGWANLDPDKAKQMLDQGAFDEFFNSDQKQQMYGEVGHYASAQAIEKNRTQKAIDDSRDASVEKWGNDNLPNLVNNTLTPKSVLANPDMTWEEKNKWLHMIDEGAKKELKTDPRVKNQLIQRIVDPNSENPVTDFTDLAPYVGKGLSISDVNQLNGLINKTPEGQALNQGTKALINSAKATIRFKDPMTNQYSITGEQRLAQFSSDFAQAKKDMIKSGGNPSDLVNPNSPNYFGNRLTNYTTTFQDQLSASAQGRTQKALGIVPSGPGAPPTQPADKLVKKPGETPADFLKRTGLGK